MREAYLIECQENALLTVSTSYTTVWCQAGTHSSAPGTVVLKGTHSSITPTWDALSAHSTQEPALCLHCHAAATGSKYSKFNRWTQDVNPVAGQQRQNNTVLTSYGTFGTDERLQLSSCMIWRVTLMPGLTAAGQRYKSLDLGLRLHLGTPLQHSQHAIHTRRRLTHQQSSRNSR